LLAASVLFSTAALAQAFLPQQPEAPMKVPDAPQLPYHFGTQITGANGEQFGNVAAVAIRPNGNLLVFNRNPNIMMVEYDPTGTKQLRVFNPNIAMNPHALRVDRYGNIWVSDSFLNVIYKLNPNGDVIRSFGERGENAAWDDKKWNGMFNQPLDIAWDKIDWLYLKNRLQEDLPLLTGLLNVYTWLRPEMISHLPAWALAPAQERNAPAGRDLTETRARLLDSRPWLISAAREETPAKCS
jgi:hypothetical protein